MTVVGDAGESPRFGELLKSARIRAGLTQHQLAEKTGGHQSVISHWETGRSSPSADDRRKLDEVLDLGTSGPEVAADEFATDGTTSPFGGWLRKTRESKGLTVWELADAAGVSAPAIYNLESGRTQNPQAATRLRLTNALETTPDAEIVEQTETDATILDVGVLTDFDPYATEDLPRVGGVYVFYDVSERPIYVGESDNIRRRVGDHSDKFWFKAPIVETAAYVQIDDVRLRKQVEATMIKFLKSNAVINKQHTTRRD
jgi:transcriptional regulator with XRE-family HTH domain